MRKNKTTSYGKAIAAAIATACFFVLLVAALIKQIGKYSGKNFFLLPPAVKYTVLALIVVLAILLVLFVTLSFLPDHGTDLATHEYFGVDFEREKAEKKKLKSVEPSDRIEEALNAARAKGAIAVDETGQPVALDAPARDSVEPAPQADEEEEPVETDGSRFYMLSEIDRAYAHYVPPRYDNEIGLKALCEAFRNYSASELKLYYDIEDIRRFIGALAVTKLIILQGMSGTGKTSLAYAFGEFLGNQTVIVPIQPMWKERTDLVGYYNEFTGRFNETTLLYKMYEANKNEEIYITVLDEMNIARVEYYFAEFLSLLEIPNPEGRNLDVVADRRDDDPQGIQGNGKMRLPTNMWFVGTANNDDSTFAISDKVYDRAMVLNLDKKAVPFEVQSSPIKKISATHLERLFERAQREYELSDRNMRRLKKLDAYMIETFHITFGNRIMKQIRAYVPVLVACGGTELEALDDILSRKVFRKLESKNPVYVKQAADGLCAYMDDLFGEDMLPLCKETVRLIEQNV